MTILLNIVLAGISAGVLFLVGMIADKLEENTPGVIYDPLFPEGSWPSRLFFGGMYALFFFLFLLCYSALSEMQ